MSTYKLKIKEYRKLKGLTQKELSEKVGISRSFLSEIENGKYEITLSILCKIAQALKISPYVLFDYTDK